MIFLKSDTFALDRKIEAIWNGNISCPLTASFCSQSDTTDDIQYNKFFY